MNRNFIKTKDLETAEKLKACGFVCIGEENGVFTFLNNESTKLDFSSNKNICYTNVLNV